MKSLLLSILLIPPSVLSIPQPQARQAIKRAPRPIPQYSSNPAPMCPSLPSQFYIVTTPSQTCLSNSSLLPNVSATSFFDPFQTSQFQLRLIGPGYLSLPLFTLSNGSLQAWNADAFGQGNYSWSSILPSPGAELLFDQGASGAGGLGFRGEGNLLAVNGSTEGWTICDGEEEESVIEWMGADSSCVGTYLQGVASPPY